MGESGQAGAPRQRSWEAYKFPDDECLLLRTPEEFRTLGNSRTDQILLACRAYRTLRLNRARQTPNVRSMKIYDFPMAPNPRRVRIFLAEKNVDMVYVHVDITKGENRTVAFMEKSPLGGLPVLEFDDGTYLTESVAICRYFEGVYPAHR